MSSTITSPNVRQATRDDAPDVITTLSLAFYDDPIFGWVIPDPVRRRALLTGVFTQFTQVLLGHRATYASSGGVAMWAPAGLDVIPPARAESFGSAVEELLGPDAARFFAISELVDEHHPSEPCAHLQFLAVEPDLQGRGLGSALMAPMLAACDRDGVPAHLDATSERSRALYQRHGFEVVEELRTADAPPLWSMWREPR